MEKFTNLPIEKQNQLINAGLITFGLNGYKKASISDIAKEANVSKSIVFHYFGTKKELYLYLVKYSAETLMSELLTHMPNCGTDFFERLLFFTEIEVSVMRRHPAILSFLKSIVLEKDETVSEDIKVFMSQGEAFRNTMTLDGIETHKFKDGIDPVRVIKMLAWFAEGYVSQLGLTNALELDEMNKEFHEIIKMIKNNFYKEAYL